MLLGAGNRAVINSNSSSTIDDFATFDRESLSISITPYSTRLEDKLKVALYRVCNRTVEPLNNN